MAPTTTDIEPSVSLAAVVRPGADDTRWNEFALGSKRDRKAQTS